jgi:hypothetical protein
LHQEEWNEKRKNNEFEKRRFKMNIKKLAIVSIVSLSLVTVVFGQGRGPGKGWGKGLGQGDCKYLRVNTPLMIEGKVIKIEEQTAGKGRYARGLHLYMEYEGKESEIHLGPSEWLNAQGLQIKEGDFVKVKACKGVYNGSPALFASEVSVGKDGKNVTVRDKNGFPMWRRSLDPDQRLYKNRKSGQTRGRGWQQN